MLDTMRFINKGQKADKLSTFDFSTGWIRMLKTPPFKKIRYNINRWRAIKKRGGKFVAAKDYRQLLEDLRAGKIEEFVVTPAEFMDFQTIYHDYEYRTQIEGKAERGGELHYHLIKRD